METIAKMKVWKPPNAAEMFDKMWNELDENHDGVPSTSFFQGVPSTSFFHLNVC